MISPPEPRAEGDAPVEPGDPPAAEVSAVEARVAEALPAGQGWRARMLGERGLPIVILAVLLILIAVYMCMYTAKQFSANVDGGYYSTIALNVRDGNGLVSNVSLRHQGFDHFPHPTPIYPLWPLTYGLLAKVFWFAPILSVGKWSSLFFSFVAMVFGYLWATRLFPRALFPRILPGFNVGHAFVLLFALNRNTVIYTALPFTEGLGFALLMFALWRCVDLWQRPRLRAGLELGAYMALLILVRSPLVLFAAAATPTLLLAVATVTRQRAAYFKLGAGAALAFGLIMGARFMQLRSMAPGIGLVEIIRWDNIQFSTLLSHPVALKQAPGVVALLKDRLQGFETAFSPTATYGYAKQYYTFHYALFLVIPALLVLGVLRARWRWLVAGFRWLTQPEHLNWIFVVLFGVAGFVSIHMIRRTSGGWFFNQRQALPSFFFFFLCFAYLIHSRRMLLRVAGGLLLLSSVVWGGLKTYDRVAEAMTRRAPRQPQHAQLISWLEKKADSDQELVVAMRQPQLIAWRTPNIGYHNFDERTKISDAMAMATKLGVDYFAVPTSFAGFTRTGEFKRRFEQVGTRSGHRLFKLKTATPATKREEEPASEPEADGVQEADEAEAEAP